MHTHGTFAGYNGEKRMGVVIHANDGMTHGSA